MTGETTARTALRTIAVAIAITALIDPAITSNRTTKPDVVVLPSDSVHDATLADDIAKQIAKTHTVVRGALIGANATIIAGRTLPTNAADGATLEGPIFGITPRPDRPQVSIESLDAPRTAPAASRVRVSAVVRVIGARGKNIDVSLRDDAVSVDHITRRVTREDDTLTASLTFVPAQASPKPLRVVAHVDDAVDAMGDALVDVREQKWAVLFYDPRPSWMSTFVRRSIERAPRFVATARVVTSHNKTTNTKKPPKQHNKHAALSLFDAVVVGAPQALSSNDVAGLEALMRRRGGNVVLLLDEPPSGPVERLIDVAGWRTQNGNQVVAVATSDSINLQAASLIWPTALPVGNEKIAGTDRPVVWREPVGAGTLVVSGALDAWRFRDPANSSFDRFWQTTIGDAASRTPPTLRLATQTAVLAPGEQFEIGATLRDGKLDARATGPLQLRGTVRSVKDSVTTLRLWPRAVGEFVGAVRAPTSPGLYRIEVSVGGRTAELPFVVAASPHRVSRGAEARLADWVHATNGSIVPASQLDRLSSLLRDAVRIEPRAVTWHPMRSAWWIIPFALALSGEWWLRRRRGLP